MLVAEIKIGEGDGDFSGKLFGYQKRFSAGGRRKEKDVMWRRGGRATSKGQKCLKRQEIEKRGGNSICVLFNQHAEFRFIFFLQFSAIVVCDDETWLSFLRRRRLRGVCVLRILV